MNSYTKIGQVLIILFLSFSMFSTTSNAQVNATNTKLILIDNSHGQFINSSLLTEAIKALQDQGFRVSTINTSISLQTLTGADLLIIPNPSGTKSFSTSEEYAMSQWMENEQGKGIIMLSNPLDITNSSLNGAPNVFNDIMQSTSFSQAKPFVVAVNNFNGVQVNKYQNSTYETHNLILNVNSSLPLPDANSSLTVDTSSSTITVLNNQTILDAGYDSFAIAQDGTFSGQDQNLQLFGGMAFEKGRLVFGGSTLMFSDLPNQYNGNKSWFNSYDNGIFFTSLAKWVMNYSNASNAPSVTANFFVLLMMSTGLIGAIFVVLGVLLYLTGKQMKIFEIDQDFLRAQAADNQEDKTGLTKSQKRLQQRMKNK